MLSPRTARFFIGKLLRQIWGQIWGSFGKVIGDINIVGGKGPGAEFGMLIFGGGGGPCGGFGTDIGYVIIVGPGKGKGQGWGTDIGDVNIGGGGLGTEMGMPILWGWVFWDRHW